MGAAAAAAAGASATRPTESGRGTMGLVSPPRALVVAAALLAGCAAKHQAPPLAVPELGRLVAQEKLERLVLALGIAGRTMPERAPIAPAE